MLQPGPIRQQGGRGRGLFRRVGLGVLPLLLILLSANWARAGAAWNEGGEFPIALGSPAQQQQASVQPLALSVPAPEPSLAASETQALPEKTDNAERQLLPVSQSPEQQDAQQNSVKQLAESAERAGQSPDGTPRQKEQAEKLAVPLVDSGSNIAKQSQPEQAAPMLLAEVTQTSPPPSPPAGQGTAGQDKGKAAQEAPSASGIRLFGTVEFRGVLKNMPKWERVLAEEKRASSFDKDLSKVMRPAVFTQWKELVERVSKASTMEKLRAVNVFFNRWPYRTDREVYGLEDYWATPYEFMKNSGDCEDYAIAKFFALKKLGVPVESMRVVALMDKIRNIGHAVLVVYVDDTAYILDNLTDLVLSHERFKQYAPQYSVNESYRWAHIMPSNKR